MMIVVTSLLLFGALWFLFSRNCAHFIKQNRSLITKALIIGTFTIAILAIIYTLF